MKKITSLFVLTLFALISAGQNTEMLQKKLEIVKKHQTRFSKFNLLMSGQPIAKQEIILSADLILKNATAEMKFDSTVTKNWIEETSQWQNDTKDEYAYDSSMKNTQWLNSDWNANSNSWEIWSKTELEYNENGAVSKMSIYESYEPGTTPVLMNTINAFYSAEGQLDSVQHWYAQGPDTWILEGKQHYHYNESGQLNEMKMWVLEEDEGEVYMSVMRFVYTYNNSGNMETSSLYFLFDEEEMLFFKTEYNFDGSGRLAFTEDWSLSLISFQLEKNTRTDYEYNVSGDVSKTTFSSWDAAGEAWIATETDTYTYYDFNMSEVLFPSYLLFFGIVEEAPISGKAVKEIETMEWLEGTSELSSKTIFYYSAGTNTFANFNSNIKFSVYPNPASESVTFSWSGDHSTLLLGVYQLSGKKVLEMPVTSGHPVSLSAIGNGIYLFELKDGKQSIHKGKLVKK